MKSMGSDNRERESQTGMTASRARLLLESYGGDWGRWPEAERTALLAWLAADAVLEAARKSEEALDDVLAELAPEEVPSGLAGRILDDFERQALPWRGMDGPRRWIENLGRAVWPGAPLWQPIAAMSLSLLIGLAAGALMLPDQPLRDADETVANSPFDMNGATDSVEPV